MRIQQLAPSTVLFTVILMQNLLFMFPVPSAAVGVSPHRPFPKGTPTGRDGELLVELRMNGAQPKIVSNIYIYHASLSFISTLNI